MAYRSPLIDKNTINFQKAEVAPKVIAKNISPQIKQVKGAVMGELWELSDKEYKFLKQSKEAWLTKDEAVAFIEEKRKPNIIQKGVQIAKDVAWWTLAWFSKLPTNIIGWAIKWLWSIPITPGLKLPDTPLQNTLKNVGSDIIRKWENTAAQNIAITWARPWAIWTQAWQLVAPIATAIVWWAATWLTKAWVWSFGTVWKWIAARSIPTIAKGVAQWAAVWGAEQALFDVAQQGKTTPESIGFWATLWAVAPVALPVAKWIGNVLWKMKTGIQKWLWRSAEKFSIKWLINVNDWKKIMKKLAETGDDDVGSIWRWALEKNTVWWSEKSVIQKTQKVVEDSYNAARKFIGESSEKLGALWKSETVDKAMTVVWKQVDTLNTRAWYDAFDKAEILNIQQAAKEWTITLAQKQRAKELVDEFVTIYKNSWDVADTQLGKIWEWLRKQLRRDIEQWVTIATDWKVNIKELNRDVAVWNTFINAIEAKEVSNALRREILQSSLWWVSWLGVSANDISEWNWWAVARNVLIWALAWKVAWNIVANPAINWKVAKILDSMSWGTRSSLLRYMKNPTNTTLSESALAEILQAKKQIEKVSSSDLFPNIK